MPSDDRPGGVSALQLKILRFIRDHLHEHGYPPDRRGIGAELEISSVSVVAYHLRRLGSAGLIERDAMVSRGLRITSEGWSALGAASIEDQLQAALAENRDLREQLAEVSS